MTTCYNSWTHECTLVPRETTYVAVRRQGVGTRTAGVSVEYSSGRVWQLKFGVEAALIKDTITILPDSVGAIPLVFGVVGI